MPAWTERAIRLEAGIRATEAAYNAWYYRYSPRSIEQLAEADSWSYEPEHRELFVQAYLAMFPPALVAFESGNYRIADNLSSRERLWLFHDFVELRLPRVPRQTETTGA